MIDRDLIDFESLDFKESRKKTMHALEELNLIQAFFPVNFKGTAGILHAVINEPVSDKIGCFRSDSFYQCVFSLQAHAANQVASR